MIFVAKSIPNFILSHIVENIFSIFAKNIDMLDIKSKLVLKILQKECHGSGYKVVDKSDVISALPVKLRVDEDGLDHIITFLERNECIHVKYDDENVYCLCILPTGARELETTSVEKKTKNHILPTLLLCSALAFIGAFLGAFLTRFI